MAYTEKQLLEHQILVNMKSIVNDADHVSNLITTRVLDPNLYEEGLKLYKIADSVYPGECDLQLLPYVESITLANGQDSSKIVYHLALIIHFPLLFMTNSNEVNHPIKDFFFRMTLKMDEGRVQIYEYRGQRTTVSYAEYKSGYRFSHLKVKAFNEPPIFLQFCFGDGDLPRLKTQFNCTASSVSNGHVTRYDIFKMLCFNIEPYLSWESLEGGPFMKLSQVFDQATLYSSNNIISFDLEQYTIKVMRASDSKDIDCDIVVLNGIYEVVDNSRLDESLVKIAIKWGVHRLIYKKDIEGNLYYSTSLPSVRRKPTPVLSDIPIQFQQRLYSFTVETEAEIEIIENKYFIHPIFKENVRKAISSAINKQVYTANFIERFHNKIKVGQEY